MIPLSKFKYKILAIVFLISIFYGCKKTEGPGGTSTIKGKVIVYDFDAGFQNPKPVKIYPAVDESTYIIYGSEGTTYDNNFKTSFDGSYEFKYLQKGKYRIFSYSTDSTGAKSGILTGVSKIPSIINVEITSNGSTVNAPDVIILKNKQ